MTNPYDALAVAFMATRPDLPAMSLDEWLAEHNGALSPAEKAIGHALTELHEGYYDKARPKLRWRTTVTVLLPAGISDEDTARSTLFELMDDLRSRRVIADWEYTGWEKAKRCRFDQVVLPADYVDNDDSQVIGMLPVYDPAEQVLAEVSRAEFEFVSTPDKTPATEIRVDDEVAKFNAVTDAAINKVIYDVVTTQRIGEHEAAHMSIGEAFRRRIMLEQVFADAPANTAEGWFVCDGHDEGLRLMRVDASDEGPARFPTDQRAWEYVMGAASSGSLRHIRALNVVFEDNPSERLRILEHMEAKGIPVPGIIRAVGEV